MNNTNAGCDVCCHPFASECLDIQAGRVLSRLLCIFCWWGVLKAKAKKAGTK